MSFLRPPGWPPKSQEIFLDGDPEPFAIILSYMRRGLLEMGSDESLARRVLMEAEYLGVDRLLEEVKATAHKHLHEGWTGSDAEAAAAFDAEHGTLVDAIRSGVLPARYFGPVKRPPEPPEPRIVQILPAPKGTRVRIWYTVRTMYGENETYTDEFEDHDVEWLALLDRPRVLRPPGPRTVEFGFDAGEEAGLMDDGTTAQLDAVNYQQARRWSRYLSRVHAVW